MQKLIADHRRGTTWDGISITCEELQEDGVTLLPTNLSGVIIEVDFKKEGNSDVYFSFTTTNNTIVVANPSSGEFSLKPRFIDYYENYYCFTVKLKYTDGTIDEIISSVWKIY